MKGVEQKPTSLNAARWCAFIEVGFRKGSRALEVEANECRPRDMETARVGARRIIARMDRYIGPKRTTQEAYKEEAVTDIAT